MINKHYCQGELKNTAILVKAKTCHETASKTHKFGDHHEMPPSCPMHQSKGSGHEDEKKDCCNDKSEFVKLDIDQEITNFELLNIKLPVFSGTFLNADLSSLEDVETYPVHYLNYKPPLIVCDFPISLQTFLL